MNERIHWLEILPEKAKIKVIVWSTFCKKRYYVFEEQIEWGKSAYAAFKDVNKMSRKEIKELYIKIRIEKINKK